MSAGNGSWLTDVKVTDHGIRVISPIPESTRALGEALGRRLWPGATLALRGPLGAGKTLLTQGVGRGLGLERPVQSPTFILIAEHPLPGDGPSALYHVDLYRLDDPAEIFDVGFGEILWADGVTVIEWADRLPDGALPSEHLGVQLQPSAQGRRIRLEPHGERYERLVREVMEALTAG